MALEASDGTWRLDSAAAAVLGFAVIAAVWWLYFDRRADVVLQGASAVPVIYSYAHLPLLMGLAAMSAGVTLLIERADEDHLGAGASVALLGGVAIVLGLVAAETVLPPLVVAGALALVLAALVVAERMLFPRAR